MPPWRRQLHGRCGELRRLLSRSGAHRPRVQPDEEYMRITYEVAPNSPSLRAEAGRPFCCRDPPMAPAGRSVSVTASPLERDPAGLLRRDWRAALPSLPHLREPVHQLHRRRQTLEVQHVRLDERW